MPTPVEPEVFKVVAALDLSLMVPCLILGGTLLLKKNRWGFPVATIASVQAALYLSVLTVNSVVMSSRGVGGAAGELPIWGALMLFTCALAVVLLRHVDYRCHQSLQ
jgi:hypothetical protein